MNLANTDCVGQDDLCKVVSTPTGVQSQTGDYEEANYIESDNFTPNNRIGEPKVSADKELDPNYWGEADNESHGEYNHELFCVTGNNSDLVDIDDLY
jgi:hypothetical protein